MNRLLILICGACAACAVTYNTADSALLPGGVLGDDHISLVYDANNGQILVTDPPPGKSFDSTHLESIAGILTGPTPGRPIMYGGILDEHTPHFIFFGWREGDIIDPLDYGPIAQVGLSEDFVLGDLSIVGSLKGGGGFASVDFASQDPRLLGVDLVYIPEPPSFALLAVGLTMMSIRRRREPHFRHT